jgi:hypothetical protein
MTLTKFLKLIIALSIALLLTLTTIRVFAQDPPVVAFQSQPSIIEFVNKIDNGQNYVVTVRDNYVYVGVGGGLQVIDISNPAQPAIVGAYSIPWAMHEEIQLRGNRLFSSSGGGLHIVDVSNPLIPTEIGYHPTLGYSTDFVLVDNVIYLSHFNYPTPPGSPQPPPNGMTILDVTNPVTPILLGSLAIPARGLSIAIKDKIAYVADMNGDLYIIDISNPTVPVVINTYDINMMVNEMRVLGNYLYAGGGFGYGGILVLDISDPDSPKEISSIGPLYEIEHFELKGHYAYLTGDELYLLDITDPANPQLIMTYSTPDYARDVDVQDNYIYVADDDNGLLILRTLQDKISETISSQTGGVIMSTGFSGSHTSLTFPAGAFTDTVSLTYRHLWLDQKVNDLVGIGRIFEFETVYTPTNQTAYLASGQSYTITVEYTDTERGPTREETLALYYWQGDHWERESSSIVDSGNNIIIATPNHLSALWAVLGETRRTYLPVVLK